MWSAIVQAACAAIVAVFTGVLLFYSHRGWQVARKAADAAARSTEIAERVYRESAQATEENLRLTRESNEATLNSILIAKSQRDTLANALRAWVVLRTVQPWNHKTNKPPRVRVELQNTGFSPAIGVHPHGTMSLTESVDFLDHEDKPPGEHDHAPLSVGFVGAGNFTKLEITGLELTADQKQAVQSGELLIYAHGLVDYVDAFGTQRRTLWAALYEPGKDYWTTASKHNSQT